MLTNEVNNDLGIEKNLNNDHQDFKNHAGNFTNNPNSNSLNFSISNQHSIIILPSKPTISAFTNKENGMYTNNCGM